MGSLTQMHQNISCQRVGGVCTHVFVCVWRGGGGGGWWLTLHRNVRKQLFDIDMTSISLNTEV